MGRIFGALLLVIFSVAVPVASAQESEKKHEELVNNVWYVLGYIDCGMTEYLDPKWLGPVEPLITIDRQTGQWYFVPGTSPDEGTQQAIALWALTLGITMPDTCGTKEN